MKRAVRESLIRPSGSPVGTGWDRSSTEPVREVVD